LAMTNPNLSVDLYTPGIWLFLIIIIILNVFSSWTKSIQNYVNYTKLGTKVVKKNVKNEKLFFFIHPKEVKY